MTELSPEQTLRDRIEAVAVAMSGVGRHRDPCRLPDTECLCGLCDFRAEARHLVLTALTDLTGDQS